MPTDRLSTLWVEGAGHNDLREVTGDAYWVALRECLDSMLNTASTIFTMDIYRRHIRPDADPPTLMRIGRWTT